MTADTLVREVGAPSEGAKTGQNDRAHEQAWGRAFVDGLVDKGIKEPLTGVLTLPGLNTLYKSVFDKDIPLPEKSTTHREGAERFFYESGGAVGGLFVDAALLSLAKPLERILHTRQYQLGEALRHGGWSVSNSLPSFGGIASGMETSAVALLKTSGQTVLQQELTQAAIAGGIKGAVFDAGANPAHADWGSRLKHGLRSSAEWTTERGIASYFAAGVTHGGVDRYFGRLPFRDPYSIASSGLAAGTLSLVLDGIPLMAEPDAPFSAQLQNQQEAAGKMVGSTARGLLLGIREDRAWEIGVHNAKELLRFNGHHGMISFRSIRL